MFGNKELIQIENRISIEFKDVLQAEERREILKLFLNSQDSNKWLKTERSKDLKGPRNYWLIMFNKLRRIWPRNKKFYLLSLKRNKVGTKK